MSPNNLEDNEQINEPVPQKLELRIHSGFEEERNRDNNALRTGMVVVVILAVLLILGVGLSKWFQTSASSPDIPATVRTDNVTGQNNNLDSNNLDTPNDNSTESQKQEALLSANEMTEEEGLAEDAGIAKAEAEYAEKARQQGSAEYAEEQNLARIQAEAEAAIAKKEALQAEKNINKCITESRTLTTEAGNVVRLSDSEAENYCQCISRSDSNDLSVKKKNCLNQLL